MIASTAITVVPVNLGSQTKDIGVCVRLDLCLHTANRVRGNFLNQLVVFFWKSNMFFVEIVANIG